LLAFFPESCTHSGTFFHLAVTIYYLVFTEVLVEKNFKANYAVFRHNFSDLPFFIFEQVQSFNPWGRKCTLHSIIAECRGVLHNLYAFTASCSLPPILFADKPWQMKKSFVTHGHMIHGVRIIKYREVLETVTYFAVSLNSCTVHNLKGWNHTLWKSFDTGWRLPQLMQADKRTFLVHV
jgi:hypothetical protein